MFPVCERYRPKVLVFLRTSAIHARVEITAVHALLEWRV